MVPCVEPTARGTQGEQSFRGSGNVPVVRVRLRPLEPRSMCSDQLEEIFQPSTAAHARRLARTSRRFWARLSGSSRKAAREAHVRLEPPPACTGRARPSAKTAGGRWATWLRQLPDDGKGRSSWASRRCRTPRGRILPWRYKRSPCSWSWPRKTLMSKNWREGGPVCKRALLTNDPV